jgi:hypothetical protein
VTARAVRTAAAALLALGFGAACAKAPTGPSAPDLASERALWSAHHLTRYAYLYELTGFNVSFAGHPIRLVVLGDTVRSATDPTTGDTLSDAASFPTLDDLFDQAAAAIASGTLAAITYDPTFDYPSRMDLSGMPDMSGSVLASSLEPLP